MSMGWWIALVALYFVIAYALQLLFEYINVRVKGRTLKESNDELIYVVAFFWGVLLPCVLGVGIFCCLCWPFVKAHEKIVVVMTKGARKKWAGEQDLKKTKDDE